VKPPFTFVPYGNYCLLSHLKSTDYGGLRNDESIIPEDTKSELLSAIMLYEAIRVLVPLLSEYKGILQPWSLTNDSLHEQLDAANIR